jgi:hypothetical protein
MNQAQLIDQYTRLQRKLCGATGTWSSGRLDRLRSALHSVERELREMAGPFPAELSGAHSIPRPA